jgi:hypothetical protein
MIYISAVYYLRWKYLDIEQLLNKAGHDIKNYQEWGLCYSPKPSAEVINNMHKPKLDNFDIMWKPYSIIVLLYIQNLERIQELTLVDKYLMIK